MISDLEIRRRRALYRAQHRGTKEMDFVLGRFAEARLASMVDPQLADFERLLALPDPDIEATVYARAALPETELVPLIQDICRFHGIGDGRS